MIGFSCLDRIQEFLMGPSKKFLLSCNYWLKKLHGSEVIVTYRDFDKPFSITKCEDIIGFFYCGVSISYEISWCLRSILNPFVITYIITGDQTFYGTKYSSAHSTTSSMSLIRSLLVLPLVSYQLSTLSTALPFLIYNHCNWSIIDACSTSTTSVRIWYMIASLTTNIGKLKYFYARLISTIQRCLVLSKDA